MNELSETDPKKYFRNNAYSVDLDGLKRMSESGPLNEGLVRFLNSLEDIVFGAGLFEGPAGCEIQILYAGYAGEFQSLILSLPVDDFELANNVTAVFASQVILLNPELDFFNVYNILQERRQSSLEMLGYFTYNPFSAPEGTLISVGRRLAPVKFLDRVEFLRLSYSDTIDKPHLDPENKIYLMVDNTNGLIKIGRSKAPKYREGTLQSKKPETHLIAIWTAPASTEKILHRKYALKKIRGEWFRLTFEDLDEIKEFMDAL